MGENRTLGVFAHLHLMPDRHTKPGRHHNGGDRTGWERNPTQLGVDASRQSTYPAVVDTPLFSRLQAA